jgi:hypothetical protein
VLQPKPWQPEAVLRLLASLFLSIASGGIVVSALVPSEAADTAAGRLLSLAIGLVTFHGVGLLLVCSFLREHLMSWREAFGLGEPGLGRALRRSAAYGLVALPVAWALSLVSALLMSLIGLEPKVQQAVETLRQTEHALERVLFSLLAVGAAPFVEEVLFRGILYPFIKQAGFLRLAWWGTSALFAVTHANVMTFLPLLALSILLIRLYEETGNLLAPIAAHALFNLVNLAWLLGQDWLVDLLEAAHGGI